jgi:hypothetical protein
MMAMPLDYQSPLPPPSAAAPVICIVSMIASAIGIAIHLAAFLFQLVYPPANGEDGIGAAFCALVVAAPALLTGLICAVISSREETRMRVRVVAWALVVLHCGVYLFVIHRGVPW